MMIRQLRATCGLTLITAMFIAAIETGASAAQPTAQRQSGVFGIAAAKRAVANTSGLPAAYGPFRLLFSSTDSIAARIHNPGNCGDPTTLTPAAACRRWRALARDIRLVGAPAHGYDGGRNFGLVQTAFVCRDAADAERVFSFLKESWILGYFDLRPFASHGLGARATGLVGDFSAHVSTLWGVAYLWQAANVVLETVVTGVPRTPTRAIENSLLPHAHFVDRALRG